MCRMIFAKGKFDVNMLIDDMIIMALDKNERHEENADKIFQHGDGWGLCYLQNSELIVHRSVRPIFDDPAIDQFRSLKTDMFILHARHASLGKVVPANVHPFESQRYVFFHNGTIYEALPFDREFHPRGTTDSERYFYYLISSKNQEIDRLQLQEKLTRLTDFSGANFILTTGQKTFIANWYAINPRYYTMKKMSENSTTIISSEILPHFSQKNWEPLKNHDILEI